MNAPNSFRRCREAELGIAARLSPIRFEAAEELAAFTRSLDGEGAIVSFIGIARPDGAAGRIVQRLFLDHHPRLTERSLERIAAEAAKRFDVTAIRIVHRCGEVRPGEPIVFAAAAARHRRAAFEAADFLMDRLKTEAVFWKREDGPEGSVWIEPRDEDYADARRWSAKWPE